MSCNFNLQFSEPADQAIQKARAAVESQNGTFNGDNNAGNFQVSVFGNTVKGEYTITGQVLNLVITDKPFFVPCSMIENFLVKQIS
jgi:hypothetical protein